ncbi:hypothetical protein JZO77_12435 [Enterococcus hulanensis]|uniref:hypothetical protein n=1 Tax=Enterococcus hulanensis TaxID=2559929 RepID=UPI001A90B323|nr:hypothetical protein [Enterococcus hulanensis]MBO0457538.1 hypothetical protein [Enterococcus hulanensis]
MEYGKVFKKVSDRSLNLKLVPYDFSIDNYSDLIKSQKRDGFRQVLFNSELMLRIVKSIYDYDYLYLAKIKMSGDTEVNIQEDINKFVMESRLNRELLFRIVDELEWYSDKESIDICEIHFYSKKTSSKSVLKNNGIISGVSINEIFSQFISPQLKRYFDEE